MVSTADAVCSLTVKEEVNIFPSASHSNLEAEGKMWWGLEGLRIRDASRVVSAGEGQGVFPWPTTRDVASQPMNEIG
jgi:hypothetical protein